MVFMSTLFGLSGCKKNEDVTSLPVKISFFDIRPQRINENETAWITIAVTNLSGETALVTSLPDKGTTSPHITSTTGNPVYIEYIPPNVEEDGTIEVIITVMAADIYGKELDRAEGKIQVED